MHTPILCVLSVGWGRDFRNEGFVDQGGIKYQLVSLVTSVQTLLRSKSDTVIWLACGSVWYWYMFVTQWVDPECGGVYCRLQQTWSINWDQPPLVWYLNIIPETLLTISFIPRLPASSSLHVKSKRTWEIKSHATSSAWQLCNPLSGMCGIYATSVGWRLACDLISPALPLFACSDKEAGIYFEVLYIVCPIQ